MFASVGANAADTNELCAGINEDQPLTLQVGQIVGSDKAEFSVEPSENCKPENRGCKLGAYALPGDYVAVVKSNKGWLCTEAAIQRTKWRAFGWLPASRVRLAPNLGGRPWSGWTWSWRGLGQRIDIWADSGKLKASAGAVWRPSNPHFGEFGGEMQTLPDGLLYGGSGDSCTVKLVGFGDQLMAEDNGKCGAINVSFSGFYTRHRLGEK